MVSGSEWFWSEEHRNYYRYDVNVYGQSICIWRSAGPQASDTGSPVEPPASGPSNGYVTQSQISYSIQPHIREAVTAYVSQGQTGAGPTEQPPPRVRVDSGSSTRYDPNMAPAAPGSVREQIAFQGTPEIGWYEPLDASYRVRTRSEEYEFFKTGRVFAMLWSETAGERIPPRNATDNSRYTRHPAASNPAIIPGRFGQDVHSQIRRFVVVRVNRNSHFVEACFITTYDGRGTLKPGCNPSAHTVVYLEGTQPFCFPGETQRGMTKDPIAIRPADSAEQMHPASRLRLGKIYSIECNVKVRDIGMIPRGDDRTKLLTYHQEEKDKGWEADEDSIGTPRPTQSTAAYPTQPAYANYNSYQHYPPH